MSNVRPSADIVTTVAHQLRQELLSRLTADVECYSGPEAARKRHALMASR